MIHSIFSNATTEQKLGILEFLKDEEIRDIHFECKNSVINFLQKKDISHEEIFQDTSLKFLGKITKISSDGVISILQINEKEISLPHEYLANVSLH